ncbi:MAG: helix-turn-helix domain-containing protein [Oscillospiraceae bacterium]|jgi:putative transcriptional regulator|nr:helix-turn-helix domain-containing protein [Oscillospiraceae bacterium]
MSEVSKGIMRGLEEMLEHAQGRKKLRSRYVATTPPKEFTADEIKCIRDSLNMSQGFFADVIGVSKKTIESWEYGRGKPSGAAARLLVIAQTDPEALRKYGFAEW